MTNPIYAKLHRIAREPFSLRTFVAVHARESRDLDFLRDLDRFPERRDILSFLADIKSCHEFFDTRYDEITAVLTDMRTT